MKKNILITTLSLCFIAPCFSQSTTTATNYMGLNYPKKQQEPLPDVKMEDLMSNSITKEVKKESSVSELRKEALIDIATTLGATRGLISRGREIKKEVEQFSTQLDNLYNFELLKIDNGVLPAVLEEGLAAYEQISSDHVTIADKVYKITEQSKFVSAYPTWRSYLKFDYPGIEKPNEAYLPKNEAENQIWNEAIKEGWKQGVNQANEIFENSYSKLERDYLGMIKYKILLQEGLITPTIIAKQNFGIVGGGKNMSINKQVFTISDHSALNPNNKEWKVEYPVSNSTGRDYK
jgi:defect-in-organelle-trafficking protein DotC